MIKTSINYPRYHYNFASLVSYIYRRYDELIWAVIARRPIMDGLAISEFLRFDFCASEDQNISNFVTVGQEVSIYGLNNTTDVLKLSDECMELSSCASPTMRVSIRISTDVIDFVS